MRLKELVGIKVLDGFHVELLGGARVFWFRLSGRLIAFAETPDGGEDGPSMLGTVMELPEGKEFIWDGAPRTVKLPRFDGIVVDVSTRQTNTVGGDSDDVLVIREKMSPKRLVCEIGTDRTTDDWKFHLAWNGDVIKLPEPKEWVPPTEPEDEEPAPTPLAPGTVLASVNLNAPPPITPGSTATYPASMFSAGITAPIAPGPRIPILPPTDAQGRPKTTTKPGGWVTETYDDEEEEDDS